MAQSQKNFTPGALWFSQHTSGQHLVLTGVQSLKPPGVSALHRKELGTKRGTWNSCSALARSSVVTAWSASPAPDLLGYSFPSSRASSAPWGHSELVGFL